MRHLNRLFLTGTVLSGATVGYYFGQSVTKAQYQQQERQKNTLAKKTNFLDTLDRSFFNVKRSSVQFTAIEEKKLAALVQGKGDFKTGLNEVLTKKFGMPSTEYSQYWNPLLDKMLEKDSELAELWRQQQALDEYAQRCTYNTLAHEYEGRDYNYLSDKECKDHSLGPDRYNEDHDAKNAELRKQILDKMRHAIQEVESLTLKKDSYEYGGLRTSIDH